jgi:hypothetical protein
MQFTVITADGSEAYDGKCKVEGNGVLKITPADKNEPTVQLSPAFWRKIEQPQEEYPPAPKPVLIR